MNKEKYILNQDTLEYQKVSRNFKQRFIRVSMFLGAAFILSIISLYSLNSYIDFPKEKILKKENYQLQSQYLLLNKKLEEFTKVLENIEQRDNDIYRTIFEAEPISKELRESGLGGVNRYAKLEGYKNSELIISTQKRVDKLFKQIYVQSKSFDDVFQMVKKKEDMLASIPAIQPVANKNLKRIASGYGMRIDPHYKIRKKHCGMDFSANRGTPVYATGDGVVLKAEWNRGGYGKHIRIDHKYGYVTLYAHLSKMLVRPGQKIKRGDLIGHVGNTGKSVGPHLHYEVRKNGNPINPVNFYFNDLTPEEYSTMLETSSRQLQSLD